MNAEEKAKKIREILEDKKANGVEILSLKGKSPIAEYFVIASGTSNTHINALADEVEEKMMELANPFMNHEGEHGSAWRLIDYGDVIVHIFSEETRKMYKLEELWK